MKKKEQIKHLKAELNHAHSVIETYEEELNTAFKTIQLLESAVNNSAAYAIVPTHLKKKREESLTQKDVIHQKSLESPQVQLKSVLQLAKQMNEFKGYFDEKINAIINRI